jgi:hypothetical protein
MLAFHLTTFQVNATPPNGHPLCGGWIKPVEAVDDPLWLRGVVLEGAGLPIVLAAMDWTGVLNESHRLWTESLADATHTTSDRVALHCVHQHNAPFVDRAANALLRKVGSSPLLYDESFVSDLMKRSAASVREAMSRSQPISHVRYGESPVEQVASNRRVLGPNGKVRFVRTSATKDPAARAEPEGTIDPVLRSIGFFQGDRPLARLYYYTVHPMSYYGDGRVTSDFVGLARTKRDAEESGALHLYFTGSAGNVTAGKYNDGSHENRPILAERVHAGMVAADQAADTDPHPLNTMRWNTAPFRFAPRSDLDLEKLEAIVANPRETLVNRNRDAMAVTWLRRERPIVLGRLDLGPVSVLLSSGDVRRISIGRPDTSPKPTVGNRGLRRWRTVVHPSSEIVRRGGIRGGGVVGKLGVGAALSEGDRRFAG